MAHSSGGRKGRAIVGLIGLAPERYFSPGTIAQIVGSTRTRVSDALRALDESKSAKDREAARVYRATAREIGGDDGRAKPARPPYTEQRHEYERGDAFDLMHTDPRCAVCGMPKRSNHHA